ncbi:hypothetical protein ABZW18_15290 [Streptomyces sp. NPDC004647]|uniref:DUF7848 domain-containing protein n=1 Tax=Streptomyces sp. NPDC004647 TaxID=3154671 RepID=UPI0033A1CA88
MDHTIAAHPDTEVTLEAQCLSCEEESGGETDAAAVDMWCLKHSGRTGHLGFRRVMTSFAVVVRAE